ncbi:MAG: hypothetical protein AB7V27_10210 [Candidatus Binatia bacterium]
MRVQTRRVARPRTPLVLAVAALAACTGCATSAFAHGMRLPFASWGAMNADALRCQRAIARAAAQCAGGAWTARRACRETELAGGSCDLDATRERILAVRRASQDTVDAFCSERQAIAVGFLGSFDLQQDLTAFCRDWERSADSGVYAPMRPDLSAAERACISATGNGATELMHSIFRARRRAMDRAAAASPSTAERQDWVTAATDRTGRASAWLADRIAARCSPADASALYGRTPAALLAILGARADCLGGAFYIQDAVLCPAAECGNRVIESGEECDGGAGCSAECTIE